MRSTVWIVDPARGRERADAIVVELHERGVAAEVRQFAEGPAVVLDDPPADLAVPDGVVRAVSVDVPATAATTRRALLDAFAGLLVLTTAGASAGIAAMFSSPPPARREDMPEIEAASLADLKAKGSVRFRFGREPCILVHEAGRIHALSLVCTHLGCLVEWSAPRKQLVCPCHRAAFGLEGNVLEGPPPRPLTSFDVSVVGDRVLVRRRTDA